MASGDILTYFHNRKWFNRVEGEAEPFSQHFTKSDAWVSGLREADRCHVDHVIRNPTGQILERTTFRDNDTARPAETKPRPRTSTGLTPPQPALSTARARPSTGETKAALRRLSPEDRRVMREINDEMRGQPAGEVLWALISRMPRGDRKYHPSTQQLAAYAAAIQAGTFQP